MDIKKANGLRQLLSTRLPLKVMEVCERMVERAFQTETSPYGQKWPARKTARSRADRRDNQQAAREQRRVLLVESGALRHGTNAEQQGNLVVITSDRPVGNWQLGQIHNEGLPPVPQRQIMPAPGEPLPGDVEREVERWLDNEMDQVFD